MRKCMCSYWKELLRRFVTMCRKRCRGGASQSAAGAATRRCRNLERTPEKKNCSSLNQDAWATREYTIDFAFRWECNRVTTPTTAVISDKFQKSKWSQRLQFFKRAIHYSLEGMWCRTPLRKLVYIWPHITFRP